MTNAIIASARVTARCGQMKPLASQRQVWAAMSDGRLKKNSSIRPVSARTCQPPTRIANTATCKASVRPRRPRVPVGLIAIAARPGAPVESGGRGSAMSAPAAEGALHFVAQVGPDLPVQAGEFRVEPDLGHVPRPLQVDVVDALDPPRRPAAHPPPPVA